MILVLKKNGPKIPSDTIALGWSNLDQGHVHLRNQKLSQSKANYENLRPIQTNRSLDLAVRGSLVSRDDFRL